MSIDQLHRPLMEEIGAVLAPAWDAIRCRHPELPAAAFTFCPLEYGHDSDVVGRHLARVRFPGRFRDYRDGISAEPVMVEMTRSGLRPAITGQPDRSFASLLHEAVHVAEWVRHGQTSNHRRRFAAIADEFGLQTTIVPPDLSFENMRRRHPYLSADGIYDRMQDYCLRNAWWATCGSGQMEKTYRREIDGLADQAGPWAGMLTRHGPDYNRSAAHLGGRARLR